MFYVYILKNDQNIFYVGQTNNLERRIKDHSKHQGAKFTKDTSGMTLAYYEEHHSRVDAMKREKQLKRWSKAKKLALIAGDITALRELSKSKSQD